MSTRESQGSYSQRRKEMPGNRSRSRSPPRSDKRTGKYTNSASSGMRKEEPAFKMSSGPAMFMGSKGAVMSKKTPLPPVRNDDGDMFKAPAPRKKGG